MLGNWGWREGEGAGTVTYDGAEAALWRGLQEAVRGLSRFRYQPVDAPATYYLAPRGRRSLEPLRMSFKVALRRSPF